MAESRGSWFKNGLFFWTGNEYLFGALPMRCIREGGDLVQQVGTMIWGTMKGGY